MARFSAIHAPAPLVGCAAALATTMLVTAATGWAGDVTSDRLVNADKEPQNWLMNHRT
jgi:hypothetical protein